MVHGVSFGRFKGAVRIFCQSGEVCAVQDIFMHMAHRVNCCLRSVRPAQRVVEKVIPLPDYSSDIV